MTDQPSPHSVSWLDGKPSNRLQKLSILVGIIGIVVSLIIAVVALRLTYKYGESTTQIDKLSTIVSEQHTEIKDLNSILGEAQKESNSSFSLVGEMKQSNEKLIAQTVLLSKQVNILTAEQHADVKLQNLANKASYTQLRAATFKLFDDTDPTLLNVVNTKNPTKSERIAFIIHVQHILETQLSNSYLLQNRKIDNDWNDIYITAGGVLSFENSTTGNKQYVKNGITHTDVETPEEVEQGHIEMFESFVKQCADLEREVIKVATWKKGQSTFF